MNDVLNRRRAATRHGRNYSWAELMKRDWAIDVLACPRCQGRMRLLAVIHSPESIRKILGCLGLPCVRRQSRRSAIEFQNLPSHSCRQDESDTYKARVCARRKDRNLLLPHGKILRRMPVPARTPIFPRGIAPSRVSRPRISSASPADFGDLSLKSLRDPRNQVYISGHGPAAHQCG